MATGKLLKYREVQEKPTFTYGFSSKSTKTKSEKCVRGAKKNRRGCSWEHKRDVLN